MDLTRIINEAIANDKSQEVRRYVGASSIGRPCGREIWYGFHGIQGSELEAELLRTFEIGRRLETMLLDYLDKTDIIVERPSSVNNFLFVQDSELPIFQGHMDAVLYLDTPHVLEIKTAKDSSFKKLLRYGLKAWSQPYYSQIQSYMGMSDYKYPRGVLLVLNKDTSELYHEWVDYDDIHYHELRTRAMAISSVDEPPERINRSPLFLVCNRCQYKKICHGSE